MERYGVINLNHKKQTHVEKQIIWEHMVSFHYQVKLESPCFRKAGHPQSDSKSTQSLPHFAKFRGHVHIHQGLEAVQAIVILELLDPMT